MRTAETAARPWKDRLERAEQGLSASDAECVQQIRALRDMPLEEYLREEPGLLKELRSLCSPPPATFGEAAAVIEAVTRSEQSARGWVLMRLFAWNLRGNY